MFQRWALHLSCAVLAAFAFAGCSQGFQSAKKVESSASEISDQAAQGKAVYNNKCSSCHGSYEQSNKAGADAGRIRSALSSIPQMAGLSLSTSELNSIAAALTSLSHLQVCTSAPDVGHVTLHRHNNTEYDNTLRDLLGISNRISAELSFPADEFASNFNNNAKVLAITPALANKYLEGAERAIEAAFANSAAKAKIVTCDLSQSSCIQTVVTGFLARAFRRPATSAEISRYTGMTALAQAEGDPIETGVKVALSAALISPHFLYRIVQMPDPNNPASVKSLTAYELASRMSYFLWSSMPDETLLTAARIGQLNDEAGLAAQIDRMLKDPKASALVDNFSVQWLQLNHLDKAQPSASIFPSYSSQLRDDMRTETRMVLSDLYTRNGSFFELLNGETTYMNERLAQHYGLTGVSGTNFRQISLMGTERIGVLTHASLLTANANPDRTSIVKRGKWVLDNLLCTPPPPPPAEVVGLPPASGGNLSQRQRMEQHRANPTCFSCHAQMDPIGFALENFDGIGKFRAMEDGMPIDNNGEFTDGRKFSGSRQLASTISADEKFKVCVAEKVFSYALGRLPESFDRCTINRLALSQVAPNKPVSALILEMIRSDAFRKQRGGGQ